MFKNHTVFIQTIASLFLTQCTFWLVYLTFSQMPPQIPFWGLQEGAAKLAPLSYIWFYPGIAVGILAVDLLIVVLTYRRQPFLVNTIVTFTTIVNLFILIIAFRVIGMMIGWF